MRIGHGRRLLAMGLCALMAAPATAQSLRVQATGQTVDSQGHGQRPHQAPARGPSGESIAYQPAGSRGGAVTNGHGSGDGVAIAVGAVATVAIICTLFCHPHKDAPKAKSDDTDDEPTADDLRQNGPHVSDVHPFGAYAVYGFVRNGWPIVVDYDSDPGSEVWVSVTVAGRTWTQDLKPGRQYARIAYRGDAGNSPQPAMFVVQSAAPNGGPPSRLDIIGLGAGPKAVGSVAIENLSFAATGAKQGQDFAHFSYQAASPFDRVDSQILHYQATQPKNGPSTISVVAVADQPVSPQAVGVFSAGRWNGMVTSSKKPSHGPHRLQVRAWEVDDDSSWVSALSSQDVLAP